MHANLAALEAVLAALPPVDGLVRAGDIVGYGPRPAACVDALRSWGDGDRDLLAIRDAGLPAAAGERLRKRA